MGGDVDSDFDSCAVEQRPTLELEPALVLVLELGRGLAPVLELELAPERVPVTAGERASALDELVSVG